MFPQDNLLGSGYGVCKPSKHDVTRTVPWLSLRYFLTRRLHIGLHWIFDFKSKTMRTHGSLRSEEASEAAWSAGRGAVVGAAKVCPPVCPSRYLRGAVMGIDNSSGGVFGAVLAGAGYAMSPIYRGLTIQFKV